jgi:hypothetical protein
MKEGRYIDAHRSPCHPGNTPLQAARDLYYIHAKLREEAVITGLKQSGYFRRFVELSTVPRVR